MDYSELTEQQYNERLRMVIVGSEGLHPDVQDIGDRRATIGWGYTLNRDNNVEIWRESGIELTTQEWQSLAAIDAAPATEKTRIGLTFPRTLSELESDQLLRASVREYEAPANQLDMPLSDERVALVSVTYNRGVAAIMGNGRNVPEHPIMDAIRDGDRAEAWYQMRYNCWGSNSDYEGGLRKRRYAESEVFDPYDDRNNVTVDEARSVYETYQSHYDEIGRVERNFGATIDGVEANPNRIAQANRDFPGIVEQYGQVQTISESLAPARTVLLEQLREQYPQHAVRFTEASFNAGQIDLNQYELRNDQDLQRRPRRQQEPNQGLDQQQPLRNTPEDPDHPDHAMLEQIRAGVRKVDESVGKPYDDISERISRSLLAACKDNRDKYPDAADASLSANALGRVDHVVMGTTGNVFAVAGRLDDPAHKRAFVSVEEAIRTPVEQSDEKLYIANEAITQEQVLARQQELARGMDGPSQSNPKMSV